MLKTFSPWSDWNVLGNSFLWWSTVMLTADYAGAGRCIFSPPSEDANLGVPLLQLDRDGEDLVPVWIIVDYIKWDA